MYSRGLGVLFILVIFLSVISSAAIINIPDDYATIQEGIDASLDGDTMLVQPGTYYENINFNGHNIVLGSLFLTTGDTDFIDSTVIDGGSSGSVIVIEDIDSYGTLITGFTIQSGEAIKGGGIYCANSKLTIFNNLIIGNRAYFNDLALGGGIYCYLSEVNFSGNTIADNQAYGNSMGSSDGGGIYSDNSNISIKNNIINGNQAYSGTVGMSYGGGIGLQNSDAYIESNTIYGNRSVDGGNGIRCVGSNVSIINSIIRNNHGDSLNTQIMGGCNSAIYCNIQDTLWPGEGNIDVDPFFRDPENGDFHLMAIECGDSSDSPCIDMGYPLILDSLLDCGWGLGTECSDMGAFSGAGGIVDINETAILLPQLTCLSQNYPNPFNAQTVIAYDLPHQSEVTIDIYDILGRQVETLVDGNQTSGSHQVIWNASDVSSGVYFYKITADDFTASKKMMLVK